MQKEFLLDLFNFRVIPINRGVAVWYFLFSSESNGEPERGRANFESPICYFLDKQSSLSRLNRLNFVSENAGTALADKIAEISYLLLILANMSLQELC